MYSAPALRYFLWFLLFLSCAHAVRAQPENNIWLFGNMGGLDFTNGSLQLYTGSAMDAYIPSVSVSDASGQLLFYSEGTQVWNRNHVVMPNGSDLVANYYPTITQGVVAMPFLEDTTKYYLFTLEGYQPNNQNSKKCLRYSVIDMSLNSGLGDIVPGQKNILLDSFMSSSLTTTRGSGCFNWLLGHKQNEGRFVAYKIDASGIAAIVSSSVSAQPFPEGDNPFGSQEMKVSPDHTKIGWAHCLYAYNFGDIELYDFDNASGMVSNGRVLDTFWDSHAGVYGIAFSPDNQKFYYTNFSFSAIYQMDLSLLPNLEAVKNSKINVSNIYQSYTGLRLGPDNKLYAKSPVYVSVINDPNAAGAACNFTPAIFTMGANYGWRLGEPVVVNRPDTFYSQTDTTLCLVDTAWISAPPGSEDYLWSDGTAAAETYFTAPGTKWVRSRQGCGFHIDTFVVTPALIDSTFYPHDTTVCLIQAVNLTAPAGYDHYTWDNNYQAQEREITQPGTYFVRSRSGCSIRVDTFRVSQFITDTLAQVHDSTVCFSGVATLILPGTYDTYLWDNGSTQSEYIVTMDGTYWVQTMSLSDCTYRSDTFHVRFYDFSLDLGNDTSLCPGDSLYLLPAIADADYHWKDGSTTPGYTIRGPGQYWVRVNKESCSLSDTVMISEQRLAVDFGSDRIICKDRQDTVQLDLGYPGSKYIWSEGSKTQLLEVNTPGTYWGTVTQGSCLATDTISIDFRRCDNCIHVPNAFSPNGDGINDFFQAQVHCPVTSFTLQVYNRFGQLVFTGSTPDEQWNGLFKGTECNIGTYFYYLEMITDTPAQSKISRKGDLTLLR